MTTLNQCERSNNITNQKNYNKQKIRQLCNRIADIIKNSKKQNPKLHPYLHHITYNTMGNNQNITQWDIKFMQNLEDQNFGNIDIFKNEQGKYIMMLRRTFMKDQTANTRDRDRILDKQKLKDKQKHAFDFVSSSGYKDYGFKQILDFISNDKTGQSQQYITPILHTQTKIENLCVVYEVIDTYCEYFNFTLSDMIKYKKQMDKEQLWLCLHWLLRLTIFLKQKDWILQEGIKLNKIFLTLKGMPTISIHHMIKSTLNDQILEYQRSFVDEIAMVMLQLSCMNYIAQIDNNLELYLRKVQKIDKYLAQILGSILRKSISLNKNGNANKTKKITQKELLQNVQKLLQQGLISQSKQIKLNKFRYILPKNQSKNQKQNQEKQQSKKKSKQLEKQKFFSKQVKSQQQKIVINSLQGRRNKENLSLKTSKKRDTFDPFQNKIHAMHIQTNGLGYNPLHTPLQTPMNKTMSIKNSLLIEQIQTRKKFTEKQKQKLSERKQLIMNIPSTNTSNQNPNMNKTSIISTLNNQLHHGVTHSSMKKQNKQNLLGNSIRQVRPSYNRKESWTRKIINQHLKQSGHR